MDDSIILDEEKYRQLLLLVAHDTWHDFLVPTYRGDIINEVRMFDLQGGLRTDISSPSITKPSYLMKTPHYKPIETSRDRIEIGSLFTILEENGSLMNRFQLEEILTHERNNKEISKKIIDIILRDLDAEETLDVYMSNIQLYEEEDLERYYYTYLSYLDLTPTESSFIIQKMRTIWNDDNTILSGGGLLSDEQIHIIISKIKEWDRHMIQLKIAEESGIKELTKKSPHYVYQRLLHSIGKYNTQFIGSKKGLHTFIEYIILFKNEAWTEEIKTHVSPLKNNDWKSITQFIEQAGFYEFLKDLLGQQKISDIFIFFMYTSQIKGGELKDILESSMPDYSELKKFTINPDMFIKLNWTETDIPPDIASYISGESISQPRDIKSWSVVKKEIELLIAIFGRWWVEFSGGLLNMDNPPEWVTQEIESFLNYFPKWHQDHGGGEKIKKGSVIADEKLDSKYTGVLPSTTVFSGSQDGKQVFYSKHDIEYPEGINTSDNPFLDTSKIALDADAIIQNAANINYCAESKELYQPVPSDKKKLRKELEEQFPEEDEDSQLIKDTLDDKLDELKNKYMDLTHGGPKYGYLLPGNSNDKPSGIPKHDKRSFNCTFPSVVDGQAECNTSTDINKVGPLNILVKTSSGIGIGITYEVSKGECPENGCRAADLLSFFNMESPVKGSRISITSLPGEINGEITLTKTNVLNELFNEISMKMGLDRREHSKYKILKTWNDNILSRINYETGGSIYKGNESLSLPYPEILAIEEILYAVSIMTRKTIGDFGQEILSVSQSMNKPSVFLSGDKPSAIRYWFMQQNNLSEKAESYPWWGGYFKGSTIQVMCNFPQLNTPPDYESMSMQRLIDDPMVEEIPEYDDEPPMDVDGGGKKSKSKSSKKKKKTSKKKKSKSSKKKKTSKKKQIKPKFHDLPSDIQKVLEDMIIWDGKDPKLNYKNCKKLQDYCEINPRKCYLDKKFLKEFVKPCQKLKKMKLDEKKAKDKTKVLLNSFRKKVPLGEKEEMIEAIQENADKDIDLDWDEYINDIELPEDVIEVLSEVIQELEYSIDPEEGNENTWESFILYLRGYNYLELDDQEEESDSKIEEFIEEFKDKLVDTHIMLNVEKYAQEFLKEIQ